MSPEEKLASMNVRQLPKGNSNGGEGPQRAYEPPRDRPPFHPIASNFPMMDPSSPEFRGLIASIKAVGLTEPITLYESMILDGRNRYNACTEARVEPRFEEFDDTKQTPLSFVLSKNLYRRHLTEGQRALKAEEMITSKHGDTSRLAPKSPFGDLESGPVTRADAARQWCVSLRAVDRAIFVREHTESTPKIIAEVKAGRMTLGRAAVLAKQTDEEQRDAPDVKFAGRKPKLRPAARPVTTSARDALTDEQHFALFLRDFTRINRGAKREGKRVVIEHLSTK
jgi:hypothetical protein